MALDALKRVEDEKLVIILTACLVKTEDDRGILGEYADLARARGRPLIVANVLCGIWEEQGEVGK